MNFIIFKGKIKKRRLYKMKKIRNENGVKIGKK